MVDPFFSLTQVYTISNNNISMRLTHSHLMTGWEKPKLTDRTHEETESKFPRQLDRASL